jgi:formate hydrogenlyase subunit 6/NADH:ubiquinone oxidoreductase subunit I
MRKEGLSGKYRNVFPELVKPGCVGCGVCAGACPMGVIAMEEAQDDPG